MARRSRSGRRERDDTHIANQQFTRLLSPTRSVFSEPLIEDRRAYHPEDFNRPPLTFDHVPAPIRRVPQAVRAQSVVVRGPGGRPLKARSRPVRFYVKDVAAFVQPRRTVVCVKRKMRKEVLHALKIAGGRGIKRSRRRSWLSNVRC